MPTRSQQDRRDSEDARHDLRHSVRRLGREVCDELAHADHRRHAALHRGHGFPAALCRIVRASTTRGAAFCLGRAERRHPLTRPIADRTPGVRRPSSAPRGAAPTSARRSSKRYPSGVHGLAIRRPECASPARPLFPPMVHASDHSRDDPAEGRRVRVAPLPSRRWRSARYARSSAIPPGSASRSPSRLTRVRAAISPTSRHRHRPTVRLGSPR